MISETWSYDEKPVTESSPQLYHYTSIESFEAMMQSREIWASHYLGLNDSSEVTLARDTIRDSLVSYMMDYAKERAAEKFSMRRLIKRQGGTLSVAQNEAVRLVDTHFGIAFGTVDDPGRALSPPFVTSFCSHQGEHPHIVRNGLLSQWRAYGRDGVCVVFNTKRLEAILREEGRRYDYSKLMLLPVSYDPEAVLQSKPYADLIQEFVLSYRIMQDAANSEPPENFITRKFLDLMIEAATRIKHVGFHEEHEVRIVALATSKKMFEWSEYKADRIEAGKNKKRTFHHPATTTTTKNLKIALNDFQPKKTLPIDRIIIAPMTNQDVVSNRVSKALRGQKIPVHRCETPYIP